MTHVFCTYFDKGYLTRALALLDSLERTGCDFELIALCLDTDTFDELNSAGDRRLSVVALSDLEQSDPELAAVKSSRSKYEYYFTLGPSLLLHLLDARPDLSALTYLDSDLYFLSDPEPLFAEATGAATVIVGHRFPTRLRHLEEVGRYNVSWVGFANDDDGRACLQWWRQRCLDWCFDRVEPDRYADQKYLDEFEERFARVHVLTHPGANVAPWNIEDPPLEFTTDGFMVDGQPLVFFHFQGLKRRLPVVVDPNFAAYDARLTSASRQLYADYVDTLDRVAPSESPGLASPRRTETGLLREVRAAARSLRRRQSFVLLPRWLRRQRRLKKNSRLGAGNESKASSRTK